MNNDLRPKLILCDIDGTLIKHHTPDITTKPNYTPEIIDGTIEKFNEWDKKGYQIILLTGRRESMREITEKQLNNLGIFYDKLIMGVGSGQRILINDTKPDGYETALAVNLKRDEGLKNLKI